MSDLLQRIQIAQRDAGEAACVANLERMGLIKTEAPAQPAQETESVLIEGIAYTLPMPVACELLRLNMLLVTYRQPAQELHLDDIAVDAFATAMKAKMQKQREKGYCGWELCPTERLQSLLFQHIGKGDPVDVGNFAMMLFNAGEKTAVPAQEPVMRACANGFTGNPGRCKVWCGDDRTCPKQGYIKGSMSQVTNPPAPLQMLDDVEIAKVYRDCVDGIFEITLQQAFCAKNGLVLEGVK